MSEPAETIFVLPGQQKILRNLMRQQEELQARVNLVMSTILAGAGVDLDNPAIGYALSPDAGVFTLIPPEPAADPPEPPDNSATKEGASDGSDTTV
jgi:hypothetical protein